MAWFTSPKERRLWLWTVAVLAAINMAAVLAGSLVDAIGSETLLGIAFGAGFGLAVAAVIGMALARRSRAEVWVALGVASAFLMIPVRSGASSLERTHLFEYGLLAGLMYEALAERGASGGRIRFPGLVAIVTTLLFGWLDEAIQALVPGRVYDVRDVLTNGLAALVAVTSLATLRRLRSKR